MIKKNLSLLFILCCGTFALANNPKYTISICMTSNLENAQTCKKRILNNMNGDVFIVKNKNRYFTNLGVFDDKKTANQIINSSSTYVKEQEPYAKLLDEKIIKLKETNHKDYIDLEDEIKKDEPIVETVVPKIEDIKVSLKKKEEFKIVSQIPQEEFKLVSSYPFPEGKRFVDDEEKEEKTEIKIETINVEKNKNIEETPKKVENNTKEETKTEKQKNPSYEEELRQISMDEFDKANTKITEEKSVQKIEKSYEKTKPTPKVENKNPTSNVSDFQQIIIEVDSSTNYMTVKAQIDNHLEDIKTYRVSTGKNDIKRPFGVGKISQISLNPVWYPTDDTLKTFRKKGIYLPSAVPPGHKYNYMGAAKINLTHIVDGKSTFRIHGTLNEKTIGTNESAGCIRMKNRDVLQLATLINDFASLKSLDNVKVVLK